MRRFLFLLILLTAILPGEEANGQGDTLFITARIPEQFLFGSPDTIIAGDFYLEIVWNYIWTTVPYRDTLLGGCFVLEVDGNGVSKRTVSGALPSPYDNVILKNGFESLIYWNTFGSPVDWPYAFLQTDYDGVMPDLFGHAFAGSNGYPGLPPMGPIAHYEFHFTGQDGGYFSIDSVFINDPSFDWDFEVPSIFTGLSLPIATPPDLPPVIDNCPSSLTTPHHLNFSYDFNGHDPDGTSGGITFEKISGPGTINAATGLWTYNPPCSDVGLPLTLKVCVKDANNPCPTRMECNVSLTVTNSAPVIGAICGDTLGVTEAGSSIQLTATDPNGNSDTKYWTLLGVTPIPVGSYNLSSFGLLTFDPAVSEVGSTYRFTVRVTDCAGAFAECDLFLNVITYMCGDANGDQHLSILDITHLINYIFRGGPPPVPIEAGDASGNGQVSILDMIYLIAYLYKGGPAPICP